VFGFFALRAFRAQLRTGLYVAASAAVKNTSLTIHHIPPFAQDVSHF
jgi:hypothetical protein